MQYSLQKRRTIVQKDKTATGDGQLISARHFDSRGRLWRSRILEDGLMGSATGNNTAGILADTYYREGPSARCTVVSNPYRSNATGDPTMGWTLTNLDILGRPVSAWSIAGATLPGCGATGGATGHTQTTYDAAATFNSLPRLMATTTDEAGATRQAFTDGLGRTTGLTEDPAGFNYQTGYGYDVLDDLVSVRQGTQAARLRRSASDGVAGYPPCLSCVTVYR